MLLARLINSRSAMPLFVAAIFTAYAAMPGLIYNFVLPDEYFSALSGLALVSCLAMCVGYWLPIFDSRFASKAPRININANWFHGVVWIGFLLFLAVTFATAENIPIISAIQGASLNELNVQRGNFLKARTGFEIVLPYLGFIFVSALLPYSLVHLFIEKSRLRYLLVAIFLAFSVSFLVKSLFLNIAFPLLYYFAQQRKVTIVRLIVVAGLGFGLLYVVSVLALGDTAPASAEVVEGQGLADFFKTTYQPAGSVDFLIWRSIAIPIITAADALRVISERLHDEPLWGATSSFLSAVFSLEPVPLEKFVYEHQFGWNELANANSVYITEAFANFRWTGVVLFSAFVGQSLRWFRKSGDVAFQALWMNYCFGLFNAGLIGMLLSNGFSLVFFLALFCSVRPTKRPVRPLVLAAIERQALFTNADTRGKS
jgi:hypothetical protein